MTLNRPLVSIVLPVYNMASFIGHALESFMEQSLRDFEVIVCDNHSSDGSADVVRRHADDRVRLIENDSNLGMVANFNKGLLAARGRYITLISADEYMSTNDSLARRVALLESGEDIDFAWCGWEYEDPRKTPPCYVPSMEWPEREVNSARDTIDILFRQRRTACIRINTVIMRADALRAMNYTIPLVHYSGWPIILTWLLYSRNTAFIREPLMRALVHESHHHDLFGSRQPFVGEREYEMIGFIDAHRARLLTMGLPLAFYEIRLLWRMTRQLPEMALNQSGYFSDYALFVARRGLGLSLRTLSQVLILPAYWTLRYTQRAYWAARSPRRTMRRALIASRRALRRSD